MKIKHIGILIPSSNTVLEPLAASMLDKIGATAHFSRLRVIDVTLNHVSLAQFEMGKHLDAAMLLCDAGVDSLVWGGTSASWLGAEHDTKFCELLEAKTGIPSGSCILEMNRVFETQGAKSYGLVTPYTSEVQEKIIKNYESMGFTCLGEQHVGGTQSLNYAAIEPEVIANMVRKVALLQPDVIFIMCTNMRGADISSDLSEEIGIPVLDSAVATLQAGVRLAGDA